MRLVIRAPMWAHALFPHRPLLPPDGPHRIVVLSSHPASRGEQLEPARLDDPDRRHRPVVSARDVFGKMSATKLTANWLIQSQSSTKLELGQFDEIGFRNGG